jgi:hypothetical protein
LIFAEGEGIMTKVELDELIAKYKVQPVGKGYIDCITTFDNVFDFIRELTNLSITVNGLTWWCHCKEGNTGCPHGMGGPKSKYYDGWFSEINFPLVQFESNKRVVGYISNPNDDEDILKCFVPALWLDVPRDWENGE